MAPRRTAVRVLRFDPFCQRPMVSLSYKVLFALVTLLLVAALVFPLFAHWFY